MEMAISVRAYFFPNSVVRVYSFLWTPLGNAHLTSTFLAFLLSPTSILTPGINVLILSPLRE